jgi:hypothetical protein
MPPKQTASPSKSSRRARARRGKKARDKLAIATQLLAEFQLRLRTHDIPYFGGACRVQVRGPTNTPFVTSLRSLLQIDYVPRQIVYPTHHVPHDCRFCPHLQEKPNPPYEYKVIQSDVSQASSEDSSDCGSEIEFDYSRWQNTSGIDDTTCEDDEDNKSPTSSQYSLPSVRSWISLPSVHS